MKFLSDEQLEALVLSICGLTLDDLERKLRTDAGFRIPTDSGVKNALVKQIAAQCGLPCILVLRDFDVFPSASNHALEMRLRLAARELRAVAEAPGAVFEAADIDALQAHLASALHSVWTVILVESGCVRTWYFDHDEMCTVMGADAKISAAAEQLLTKHCATG